MHLLSMNINGCCHTNHTIINHSRWFHYLEVLRAPALALQRPRRPSVIEQALQPLRLPPTLRSTAPLRKLSEYLHVYELK
ncbi:hypothetical protein SNOG_08025 [Parastagonospora nodorum SN15]|uniref:Uncharacterized protein n=1 Tax=Phaeosphaeria nodorum (strain SN15 / ATCC MYA-4574 / FGSC 10173) TaxID=321614 RepID=Q0UJN9_PHANO|nr:hypothetical protein SNOG_08025 [Parastagonospora nodorum SN15]EAT84301.1 hypothetical protein SNOG_08025 [Parastagonospora nodorum SN15]